MPQRKSKKQVKAGKKAGRRLKQEIQEGKKADKVGRVMEEFKEGMLHSGSKKGPKVTSKKQALAIGLAEARRAKKASKKKKR